MRRTVFQRYFRRVERELQHHHVDERPARSWRGAQVTEGGGRSWYLFYTVTWSPGVLALTGDIESLIVRHDALGTARGAAQWINSVAFDYLMSKSTAKKEYSREATSAYIIEQANAEAIEVLSECLKEARRYRADRAQATNDEDLPDPRHYDLHPAMHLIKDRDRNQERPVADGYSLWSRMGWELDLQGDPRPNSSRRREITADLEAHLGEGGPEKAVELCQDLGLDDYYGSYEYTIHHVRQYAALKQWAEHLLAVEPTEQAA